MSYFDIIWNLVNLNLNTRWSLNTYSLWKTHSHCSNLGHIVNPRLVLETIKKPDLSTLVLNYLFIVCYEMKYSLARDISLFYESSKPARWVPKKRSFTTSAVQVFSIQEENTENFFMIDRILFIVILILKSLLSTSVGKCNSKVSFLSIFEV